MKQNIWQENIVIVFIALICCTLWGSAFPTLKLSYIELGLGKEDVYSKIVLAGMRFFIASLLVFGFYIVSNKTLPKVKYGEIKYLFILGIMNTTIQYLLFYIGLSNTTGVKAAVLVSSGSFFIILIAHFIYKNDKLNRYKILGMILGFLGVFAVNWTQVQGEGVSLAFKLSGEGFLILASITTSFGTIGGKIISQRINPVLITAWQMLFGSIMLLIIGIIGDGGFVLVFNNTAILLLLYTAFLSAVAFSLWYTLLKYNKVSHVSIFKFLIPVTGSILSATILVEESFTRFIIIGLVMVSAGIFVANKSEKMS